MASKFNRTGIDWCGWTWNPVVGCRNGCEYCYARKAAKRMVSCQKCLDFEPHLHPERLLAAGKTTPPVGISPFSGSILDRVFIGSMTDFYSDGVHPDWIRWVAAECERWTDWTYLILTKRPEAIAWRPLWPKNVMIGVTLTQSGGRVEQAEEVMVELAKAGYRCFVSCEPLLGPLDFKRLGEWCSWLIVGPQTNPIVQPDPSWVLGLIGQAEEAGVPVWTKDRLVGAQYRQEPRVKRDSLTVRPIGHG